MQDILINWSPQETRVAIVENGAVQELHVERTLERGLVGNIYTGRVARVLPGMQSAFIDIGLERAAFLHVADVHHNGGTQRSLASESSGAAPMPIETDRVLRYSLPDQVLQFAVGEDARFFGQDTGDDSLWEETIDRSAVTVSPVLGEK